MLKVCPGKFCGYTFINGLKSSCGPCPRGYRPDVHTSLCKPCSDSPLMYDWLFLGFMAILSLLLHLFFIDTTTSKNTRRRVYLHISSLVEAVVAAIVTVIVMEPRGSLSLKSCHVQALDDWYPVLHNPSPNYTTTYHCTQEAVYPLYTLPMVYYGLNLVIMMLTRPLVCGKLLRVKASGKCIYAALYFLPMLTLIQAVAGGLLYYSFPYILLVGSLVTLAIHLSQFPDQDVKSLIKDNVRDPRNLLIVTGHWFLHAYGILAITRLKNTTLNWPMLALVPVPTFYYIFTSRFTLPDI